MNDNVIKGGGCVGVGVLILGFLSTIFWYTNSHNPYVPAGYVAYQTQGAWFGKASYYGTLKGPSSPGLTWMLDSFNVSVTPYTYSEEFSGEDSVLSVDNLKIAFRTHIIWRVKEDSVKEFVERFSTIDPKTKKQDSETVVRTAYDNVLRKDFRTFSRAEVQRLEGMKGKEKQIEIGKTILANMRELAEGKPFDIINCVVGNIQYPKTIEEAVAANLAAEQLMQKEKKDAERRIIQAEGIAKAMAIINEKLTPQYLQHEAIDAQKQMVGGPNHTVVYIPVGPLGMPIVGTMNTQTGK